MHRQVPRRLLIPALLVLAAAVAAPTAATGTGTDYAMLFTDEQLTRAAPVIAGGRVFSVDTAWDTSVSMIYTYVTLDVTDVYKEATFEPVPERIVLKQLGGAIGDIGLSIGGQTEFQVGEEVLVFLAVRPRDRTLYTMGLWQGKWNVVRGANGAAVARRNAGLTTDGEEASPAERVLGRFVENVSGFAASSPAPAEDVVFVPEEAPAPTGFQALKIPLSGFSWHNVFSGISIPVNFDKATQPGVGKGKAQNKSALGRWNADKKSLDVFRAGKKNKGVSPGTGFRDPAGNNSGEQAVLVQDRDPQKEIADNGPVLAIGGAWFFAGRTIRKLAFAASGFVVMNDSASANNFIRNVICYINVLAHELGHVGGLGHSNRAGNLMFASVTQALCNVLIALGNDDLRFWRKMYKTKFGS